MKFPNKGFTRCIFAQHLENTTAAVMNTIDTLLEALDHSDDLSIEALEQILQSNLPSREEILAAWAEFQPLHGQHLLSAPEHPVVYDEGIDRPQPRLDVMRGNGMTTTVGRLRPCNLLDWKFVLTSHNVLRGAAGAAILNAEVLARLGKLNPARKAVLV